MRTFIGFVVVLAFLWVAAAPAGALDLPVGSEIKGKVNDVSGLFRDGDGDGSYETSVSFPNAGTSVLTPPGAVGDELRAAFVVNQLFVLGELDSFFTSSASERLCGIIYGLEVIGISGQTIGFGLGSRYTQAYIDIYRDTDAGVENFSAGPGGWVEGDPAGPDTYGELTNGELWLRAAFVPLGTPLIAGSLYQLTLDVGFNVVPILTGTGNGFGYADVLVNNTGVPLDEGLFNAQNGGIANSDMSLQINIDWRNKPYNGWEVSSEDPILFGTIPEPASMSLLLVGLVGGAGAYWRRRRAA